MSDQEQIQTYIELPEGAIPVKVIEVVKYVTADGNLSHIVSWQGSGDVIEELGMLEYAKLSLYTARNEEQEDA